MEEQPEEFVMTPLGPVTDDAGRWCCGLHCGRPCPYRLKLRPAGRPREAPP